MKIFLVCNSLGGGGAERVHVNLANGFAQRGHEVYLIADVNQPASYPVDEQVHVLPLCPLSTNKLKKWGGAVSMLRKNIKKYKPDVVIGNMHLCSLISKIAALGTRIPVILTIHNALEHKEYHYRKRDQLWDRFAPPLYSATTVLTQADSIVMHKKYGFNKNVYVMPNPLTYVPLSITDNHCLVSDDGSKIEKKNIILAAGRLDNWRYKGWDILIEAAAKMKPLLLKYNWKIYVAGGGSDKTKQFLYSLQKDAGVEDCLQFVGYRTDMKNLFKEASVFCLSSRSEGLPMVLIEAMSQGCAPVACDNIGRTKEIITSEEEGLLYQTADIDGLVRQLSFLLVNDNVRSKIQCSAIMRSKFFMVDRIIDKWEVLLRDISK